MKNVISPETAFIQKMNMKKDVNTQEFHDTKSQGKEGLEGDHLTCRIF